MIYINIIMGDYMNKRGFTLVELLAVIIILGLILSIVGGIVVNFIDESKAKSTLASANQIKEALDEYYFGFGISGEVFDGYTCVFPNNCDEIKFNGEIPKEGNLTINSNGVINGFVSFGDNYIYQISADEIRKVLPSDVDI